MADSPEHSLDLYRQVAEEMMPDVIWDSCSVVSSQFHDVVLAPGVGAIRVARSERAGQDLRRSTELIVAWPPLICPSKLRGRCRRSRSWRDVQQS